MRRRFGKARIVPVEITIGANRYWLVRLNPHPDVARWAMRFQKLPDKEVYDVVCFPYGIECDCLGFLRWGRCKHINFLIEKGVVEKLDSA